MKGKKKETNPFYSSTPWKKLRKQAMNRDLGFCVWCLRAGRYTLDRNGRRVNVRATMVHHIEPLEKRPDLALDLDNLVSLCDDCHDKAHPEKHEKAQRGKMRDTVPEIAKGIRIERL